MAAGCTSAPDKLERADRWFERYGDLTVFIGRVIPVVRSFIAIPAGIARVKFVRYTVLTFLGTVPWCFGLAGIGYGFGRSYERFQRGLALRRLCGRCPDRGGGRLPVCPPQKVV